MGLVRGPLRRLVQATVVVLPLLLTCSEAEAARLGILGDRFTVDGEPKFLIFMSYFGAMGDPHVDTSFRLLRRVGFDGIRIWPNLDTGPQLMNADGSLRREELNRLLFILDQARANSLIVDVTFTYEHIREMDANGARAGIVAAADALRSYDNLLFDIQNERNVQDRRRMSEADVARILAAVKAAHPQRVVTASNSPVDSAEYAADFTARLGLDVTAYHDPRTANWYTLAEIQSVVRRMKSNGRPAYLQEPMRRDDRLPANDRAEYFLQAVAHAKLAGAAAWCFHTHVATDFRKGPALLEDRLRQIPEPEWTFVSALSPQVAFRAHDGVHYVVADGGGGADVRADRTSIGGWETFRTSVLNGGPLVSGDRVALRAADDVHYLQAIGGGGAALRAVGTAIGPFETFVVEKAGGGIILHDDAVTLRVSGAPWYVGAESGGGGNVVVNSASAGPWETFRIQFVSPHISGLTAGRAGWRN